MGGRDRCLALTALEAAVTTAAGGWLAWLLAGPVGAVVGGVNGLLSGVRGVYDPATPAGWFALVSDSTWSLLGTALGTLVHVANLVHPDARYRADLSRRQNRHVYEHGFALRRRFAFTQGNVVSNAGLGTDRVDPRFLANHEGLHIWQQRVFGPLFQATYVVWALGGLVVAATRWLWHTETGVAGLRGSVMSAAYYDNPFEYWAYRRDGNWPPAGSDKQVAGPPAAT